MPTAAGESGGVDLPHDDMNGASKDTGFFCQLRPANCDLLLQLFDFALHPRVAAYERRQVPDMDDPGGDVGG